MMKNVRAFVKIEGRKLKTINFPKEIRKNRQTVAKTVFFASVLKRSAPPVEDLETKIAILLRALEKTQKH